jgi:predicted 2-oxoglutarate/Fe(II)-dependent dioxygenase YbiX
MIREEIAPGIMVYSDVIKDSQNLFNDIEEGIVSANKSWENASIKAGDENPGVDTMARNTLTVSIPYLGEIKKMPGTNLEETFNISLNNIFFESFDPIEKDYMANYSVKSDWHCQYGILKYGKGHFFINHVDDHADYHRRISTVYYLNDNYTGGEINFPRFNITFKPKANQMIFFPSTYVYNHSVSPVIEGERYAVVSWMR